MRASVAGAAGIMLLSLLLLQGCGRKGPLYLPVKPADQSASPNGSQAAPQPAPSAAPGK